ncbi:MAG: hypothetical protein IJA05_06270 [Oscillospiraceae bacterium]|nr:hypothetical protein [Oscillospiraceae bacterium]
MINFTNCIRCGSKNIDKLMVNTRVRINYPEKRNPYTGSITQEVLEATDALVCKDCGHIEFFIDWEKIKKTK